MMLFDDNIMWPTCLNMLIKQLKCSLYISNESRLHKASLSLGCLFTQHAGELQNFRY